MSTYARAEALASMLTAGGVVAVTDARSATPPCVLIVPPVMDFDLNCGRTLTWSLFALAPGLGNADAWQALDALVDTVADMLDVSRAEPTSYVLSVETPAVPAYRITVPDDSIPE